MDKPRVDSSVKSKTTNSRRGPGRAINKYKLRPCSAWSFHKNRKVAGHLAKRKVLFDEAIAALSLAIKLEYSFLTFPPSLSISYLSLFLSLYKVSRRFDIRTSQNK